MENCDVMRVLTNQSGFTRAFPIWVFITRNVVPTVIEAKKKNRHLLYNNNVQKDAMDGQEEERYLLQQQRDGVDGWCIPTPQITVEQQVNWYKASYRIYVCNGVCPN